ncbi:HD domain-containing phosphohydrolase [Azospirillum picis]|uniref:Response regulator RpfG family c-di-GMP phosphodiesterase n=1 Tax=Azospirillum picis TaxID=488438 RepID=A0ABU0MDS8_9PROT|nr:HD domain-containing phosphohydrolase [Azospirillum picis]MBP2297573.1 response regulator RpfG family c-di-GMP phosphodiesterase [Azospirillum picis]MDQ0531404.1 response regulator RpfG family c-di-GMP phosphodiesterase [Azospirillum picis]
MVDGWDADDATSHNDVLEFAAETEERDVGRDWPPWLILIVDDDMEVHAITRVVLGEMVFEERPVRFLSAYSARQARDLLAAHPGIAAILLDVVMETDDAGLRLVRHIRDGLGNHHVRIILRTGQPGQAPERQVIAAYDINDYKAKSELTAQKLYTATVAALRSYRHIDTIERNRRGLERVMEAADRLAGQRTCADFLAALPGEAAALMTDARSVLLPGDGEGPGGPPELAAAVAAALGDGRPRWGAGYGVAVLRSRDAPPLALCLLGGPFQEVDRPLFELLCAKAATALDNLRLYERLHQAQVATVHALGKLAEYKDEVTGDHVRRLGRWATAIARELRARGDFAGELDEGFCDTIGLASVLHDVGKVGIPDAILRKPGRLDPAEMAIMREHAAIGGSILRDAGIGADRRGYLSMGAEIAESHHEKFDGSGYPHGLAGDAIPLSGRIVAVVDVFDALLHHRPYKKAWDIGEVLDLLRTESGRHFDPRVVSAFLAVLGRDGAGA